MRRKKFVKSFKKRGKRIKRKRTKRITKYGSSRGGIRL